jgi:hypothetical protein
MGWEFTGILTDNRIDQLKIPNRLICFACLPGLFRDYDLSYTNTARACKSWKALSPTPLVETIRENLSHLALVRP